MANREKRRAKEEKAYQLETKIIKALHNTTQPIKHHGAMDILFHSQYVDAVNWARSNAIRDPKLWNPIGKSIDALYFSFITHSLVKHPLPKHLYQFIYWKSQICYPRDFFVRVAQGESVYKVFKETFTLPITRKWAHILMTETHGIDHPVKAIRLAQVLAHDGNQRLYQNLPIARISSSDLHNAHTNLRSRFLHDFGSIEDEKFYDDVIAWFCRQTKTIAMFDYGQVEPILDFFKYSYGANKNYSVAGRTLASVMKAMLDWHKFLGKDKGDNTTFKSCGIPTWSREVEYEEDGQNVHGVWKIEEITSSRRLSKEGHDMRHCVASYAGSIKAGKNSIFSMTFQKGDGQEKKQATIRIDPNIKTIMEARGFANALLAPNQRATLKRWANENGIGLGYY